MTTTKSNDLSLVTDKAQLRKTLRGLRRALESKAQHAAAESLLDQLIALKSFRDSKKIAMYLANDGEIDPVGVIDWCQRNERKSYLPVVMQQEGRNFLLFAEVSSDSTFKQNKFGILEPVVGPSELVRATDLDLVLLPLVGFDGYGNRLGMGGGFYDTTFEFLKLQKKRKPKLIGIAHEIQRVEKIAAESWDVPLNMVVTDQHTYELMS